MNKILLIIAFLLTTQSAHAATLTKAPNNLGLVGYWSFNDCRGLKATDFSGYGNHGTLTSGPSWGTGRLGCGIALDGTNDYIEIADSSSLDSAGGTSYSYGMWIKTTSATNRVLMEKGANGFFMLQPNTGGADLYINTIDLVAGGWTPFRDGNWHHLFVVYSVTSNTATLYKDGSSIAVVTSAGGSSANNSVLHIGSRAGAYSIAASIDEVRIYNRALGDTEVARLYSSASSMTSVQGSGSDASGGLVAHWKLDDRAGATAVDSSGRGNSGTLSGFSFSGATSNWVAGYRGGGLNFDAVDDYVTLPSASGFSSTQDHAFAVWVYPSTLTGTYIWLLDYGGGSGTTGSSLIIYSATDVPGFFYNGGSSFVVGARVIPTNQWSHIVASYSSSTNKVTFYVNGTLDTETATLGAWSSSTSAHYIGRWFNGGYSFLGSLDDVRVYNRTLTAEEVRNLYSVGSSRPPLINVASNRLTAGTSLASGLAGHWTFDGRYLNTTTATDTSGQGLHGTLTNGPAPVIGKMGQALSFDGSNDYINAGRPAFFDESPTKLTLSAWIKPTSISGYQAIIGSNTASIPYYFLGMGAFYGSPNALNVQFRNNSAVMNVSAVAPSIEAGKWSHVTVVWDGSQPRLTFYVDGAQISTTTTNILTSMDPLAAPRLLGIGGDGGGAATSVFPGTIDEVRIYTRALTSTEVTQLYNLGR